MSRTLTVCHIERITYDAAVVLQRRLAEDYWHTHRDAGTLLLLEHPPVITIGRSSRENHILASDEALAKAGVIVRGTNRGGDVTYHGPGQVVGYPILPLAFHGRDIHAYLRRLEAVLIATLADYGIEGSRQEGLTGVWTEQGKIASIGVAVSHWIIYHGFALNVAPNMEHFKLIRPCGIAGVQMTCMRELLGVAPGRAEMDEHIVAHFASEFGFHETRVVEPADLYETRA